MRIIALNKLIATIQTHWVIRNTNKKIIGFWEKNKIMSRREKENANNVGCKENIRIILNVKP
jgi:hypothetical protein